MRSTLHIDAYIASLPAGLDSYPEHCAKASGVRLFYEEFRRQFPVTDVPLALLDLTVFPVTSWVSEVKTIALLLAMRGEFPDDDAFLTWCDAQQRTLLGGPLYRVLFALVGPKRIFMGVADRWARLHRGLELLSVLNDDGNSGDLTINYPPHLMPRLRAQMYVGAFVAALQLAGGQEVRVRLVEHTTTHARFHGRWR